MNESTRKNFIIQLELRKKNLNLMKELSLKQLNTIPKEFANNIIWNMVHVMVITDFHTYGHCGLDIPLRDWLVRYQKGTSPDANAPVTLVQLNNFKTALLDTHHRLENDYEEGKFAAFTPYRTGFGVNLIDIEHAISYAVNHEMLHFGYSLVLKKLV